MRLGSSIGFYGVHAREGVETQPGDLLTRIRTALVTRLSPADRRELDSLQAETDPALLEEAIVHIGIRLESSGNLPAAAELYRQVLANPNSSPCQARAQGRLDILLGQGSVGGRAEFLLRGLAEQAAEPSALLAMGAAGTVFRMTRLATLSRLTAEANPGWITRFFGAGRLASLAGFAAEAPTFTLASRLGNEVLGRPQDWSGGALRRDFASSTLALGGLRLFGAAGSRLASGQSSLLQGLVQQGSMLGGILFSHRLETWAGLRPRQEGAAALMDSLALLLQFHVAGNLSRGLLGPGVTAWEQRLDLQAESLGRSSRVQEATALRPLALSPAQGPRLLPNTEEESPLSNYVFAMSQNGKGREFEVAPGPRPLPANHNTDEISTEADVNAIPAERLRALSRGGVILDTEAGKIQFGVPMWTNKDAFEIFLQAGGPRMEREEIRRLLPSLYIFDLDYVPKHDGLLPADFMQYMFFVNRGQESTLVAPDAAIARRLRDFLDLSYQGPNEQDLNERVAREYVAGAVGKPQMGEEIRRGFPAAAPETLRKIVHFDEDGNLTWGEVRIQRLGPRRYEVWHQGNSLGVLDLGRFPLPEPAQPGRLSPAAKAARRRVLREGRPALWPIGTGHGFTPREETSGFMLWNQGKTVLIDPPSSTLDHLRRHGLPLEAVDGILLTHGHTDHYGNAIPQLLAQRPELKVYTTPTIFRMLQEQYHLAVGSSGLPWHFVPLFPQNFSEILGLHLRPEYSFHPVPALGFEIYDRPDIQSGKLVVSFTGDTFADPVEIWRHTKAEAPATPVMSVARAQQILRHNALLMASKGQRPAPVFLIEGGVPPIHIPPARTRELLDHAEQHGVDTSRIFVYHVAAEAAAAARVPKWIAGPDGFLDLSDYFRAARRR